MKKRDIAIAFANPRLLAAIYFGLLSVVGTILIDAFLSSIGIKEIIPVFQAIILGMIVSSCTGALVGEKIVHCKKPYMIKTFFMVIASLPIFDLGLLFFMSESNNPLFSIAKFHDMMFFYLMILGYSYILFGFLLAVASGLAAMYLRGKLVYDMLHADDYPGQEALHVHAPVKGKKTARDQTVRKPHR
jgi:hypothetical protein